MQSLNNSWSKRPWFLAAFLSVAGLIYHLVIDGISFDPDNFSRGRLALAVFILVAATSFAFTLERKRWQWSLVFSLVWGLILAGVAYWTLYQKIGRFSLDFPFWSGLLAAAIAVPLFQTIQDQAKLSLPYKQLHGHAWSDVVCWIVAWAFVGISFALAHLLAALFDLVGLEFLKKLLREDLFIWMMIGATFGAALGILKEHQKIIGNLQNLVMTVLSTLAPVLAIGLAVFLISLPFTGLQPLWDATARTTPILLSCAAGALLLGNAIIRNSFEEESQHKLLRIGSLALSLTILPLAIIAFISMQQRIEQYGYTPDRIWGLIAVGVALAYGIAYLASVLISRRGWMNKVRGANTLLAVALCAVAVFLALPVMDFGAISVKDQLARIEDGRTKPEDFDFVAFAYDFGEKGREALDEMKTSDDSLLATGAKVALESEYRWQAHKDINRMKSSNLVESRLVVFPKPITVSEGLMAEINKQSGCLGDYCLLIWATGDERAKLVSSACENRLSGPQGYSKCPPSVTNFAIKEGKWQSSGDDFYGSINYINQNKISDEERKSERATIRTAIENGEIEIRPVAKQQVFIGGKPVGEVFDVE